MDRIYRRPLKERCPATHLFISVGSGISALQAAVRHRLVQHSGELLCGMFTKYPTRSFSSGRVPGYRSHIFVLAAAAVAKAKRWRGCSGDSSGTIATATA